MVKFEKRYDYIGGSDFGSVLDCNPYKKRIELVLEKAQVLANTFEGNAATRRGEKLEDAIIDLFEQETGLKVTNKQKEYTKEKREGRMRLTCHVDGMVKDNNGQAVFEAKTTDIKGSVWDNGIPEYYKAQLEFNMYLAEVDTSYIAVGYCNDNELEKFEYFTYKKQMKGEEIEKVCESFTQDVEKYKQLGVINTGIIKDQEIDGDLIDRYQSLIEEIKEKKEVINPLEKEKKMIEDKIKKMIGNDAGIQDDCYVISLGNRITSPSVDYKICRTGIKIQYKGE